MLLSIDVFITDFLLVFEHFWIGSGWYLVLVFFDCGLTVYTTCFAPRDEDEDDEDNDLG